MCLEKSRVLVTGGVVFISSEVVKLLCEEKSKVFILDKLSSSKIAYIEELKKLYVFKGDICKKDEVSEY